jgi:hypothetical protein
MPKTKKKRIKPYTPAVGAKLSQHRQDLSQARREFAINQRKVMHGLKTDPVFYDRIERVVGMAKKYISQNKDGTVVFPVLPIKKVTRADINSFSPDDLMSIFAQSGSVMPFILLEGGDIYPMMTEQMLRGCWFEDGFDPFANQTKQETKIVIQEKKVIDNNKVIKLIERVKRDLKITSYQLEAINSFIEKLKAEL